MLVCVFEDKERGKEETNGKTANISLGWLFGLYSTVSHGSLSAECG